MSPSADYEKTLKPGQVETFLDLRFFRPAAYQVVRLALPTPITPNMITLASIGAGLGGALLLRSNKPRDVALGSALMVLYGVLDCADGQLARARGTSSRLGRILDGASDYIVGAVSGTTLAMRLGDDLGPGGALLGAASVLSVVAQGTLFDHFKNRYLARSGGSYREGDDLAETIAAIAELEKNGGAAATILLHEVYAIFLRIQRLASGGEKGEEGEERPDPIAYRARLASVAKGWAYLGPSTHVALLAAFSATGHLREYAWLRLTVGNAAMALLWILQREREREVLAGAAVT